MDLPPENRSRGRVRIGLRISIGGQDEEGVCCRANEASRPKRAGLAGHLPAIGKLREAEVLLGQRSTVGEVSRKLGVTEQTYCWQRREGA